MTDEDSTLIKIQLATIIERVANMQEAAEHRHNNLKMSLEGMASKKELEGVHEKIASTKADLSARITKLEDNQSRVVWALLGTMGGVVIQILGLTKKFGL